MLDFLYDQMGFWPTLLLLWSVFVMIIFWFAGMAGMMLLPPKKSKTLKLFFGILVPPYTVFWMIYDMFEQRKLLKQKNGII